MKRERERESRFSVLLQEAFPPLDRREDQVQRERESGCPGVSLCVFVFVVLSRVWVCVVFHVLEGEGERERYLFSSSALLLLSLSLSLSGECWYLRLLRLPQPGNPRRRNRATRNTGKHPLLLLLLLLLLESLCFSLSLFFLL